VNTLSAIGLVLHVMLLGAFLSVIFREIQFSSLTSSAWGSVVIVLVLGGFALCVTPESAANLPIVPDSVEYAVTANRIVTLGRYDISLLGVSHPSRYPPGFPLVGAVPYLLVFGDFPGNAIWFVNISIILSLLLAFLIGHRVGGRQSGYLCAVSVGCVLLYERPAVICPHIPCVAITLASLLTFLQIWQRESRERLQWLFTGLLIAFGVSFRPLSVFLVLPFLVLGMRRAAWRKLLLLIMPVVIAIGANLAFQSHIFGTLSRNGYHYWCSIPYDYLRLTFGLQYVGGNAAAFLQDTLIPLFLFLPVVILTAVGSHRVTALAQWKEIRACLIFAIFGVGPLIVFHFLYFFPSSTFFFPASVLFAVAFGLMLSSLMQVMRFGPLTAQVFQGLLLVPLVLHSLFGPPLSRERIQDATFFAKTLPDDATIITAYDPVFLEPYLLRGSRRQVIPVSRRVEYASKLVAPSRTELPEQVLERGFAESRDALKASGVRDAVDSVAIESTDPVAKSLRAGRSVFFALGETTDAEQNEMRRLYVLGDAIEGRVHPVLALQGP